MLNRMCMMSPCRNMYVTTVQGRTRIRAGTNANASVTRGIVSWTKKTAILATNSRRTQRVTESIERTPKSSCESVHKVNGPPLLRLLVSDLAVALAYGRRLSPQPVCGFDQEDVVWVIA